MVCAGCFFSLSSDDCASELLSNTAVCPLQSPWTLPLDQTQAQFSGKTSSWKVACDSGASVPFSTPEVAGLSGVPSGATLLAKAHQSSLRSFSSGERHVLLSHPGAWRQAVQENKTKD